MLRTDAVPNNPLDLVEEIVVSNDWAFDRMSSEELVVEVRGRWTDYSMLFAWQSALGVMQFCCGCEMNVPETRRARVYELLAHVNERMWIGSFGVAPEAATLTFRHAALLRGARGASLEALEDLVEIAINEVDRFYPAFQFVLWGGHSPADAVTAAMLDPVGEA